MVRSGLIYLLIDRCLDMIASHLAAEFSPIGVRCRDFVAGGHYWLRLDRASIDKHLHKYFRKHNRDLIDLIYFRVVLIDDISGNLCGYVYIDDRHEYKGIPFGINVKTITSMTHQHHTSPT